MPGSREGGRRFRRRVIEAVLLAADAAARQYSTARRFLISSIRLSSASKRA